MVHEATDYPVLDWYHKSKARKTCDVIASEGGQGKNAIVGPDVIKDAVPMLLNIAVLFNLF